jgi:hypothetical protein
MAKKTTKPAAKASPSKKPAAKAAKAAKTPPPAAAKKAVAAKPAAKKEAPVKPAPAAKATAPVKAAKAPSKKVAEVVTEEVVALEASSEAPVAKVKAPKAKPAVKPLGKRAAAAAAAEAKAIGDSNKKWADLVNKHGSEKAIAYSMRSTYEPNTPIQHKIFGWGFILHIENDRLEVLFENGTKMLISNYKS